jgi:hypothetical protein
MVRNGKTLPLGMDFLRADDVCLILEAGCGSLRYRMERTSFRAAVSPVEVQRLSRRTLSPTIGSATQIGCFDKRSTCSCVRPVE